MRPLRLDEGQPKNDEVKQVLREVIVTRFLTAGKVARTNRPGIRRSHAERHRVHPLVRPAQRTATDPFPAVGGTQVQNPPAPSDFQVPQLVLSFDRVIPSDLGLLDGAVAETTGNRSYLSSAINPYGLDFRGWPTGDSRVCLRQ